MNGRAGLLASGSAPLRTFPGWKAQWPGAIKSGYSGGPAPVSHRLPYSPFRAPSQYL